MWQLVYFAESVDKNQHADTCLQILVHTGSPSLRMVSVKEPICTYNSVYDMKQADFCKQRA